MDRGIISFERGAIPLFLVVCYFSYLSVFKVVMVAASVRQRPLLQAAAHGTAYR